MGFSITNGEPTPEEFIAIQVAISQHKREVLKPVIRRSVYGLPQLRQALPHQLTFGARKNA